MAIVAGTAVADTSDRRPWQLGIALLACVPTSVFTLPFLYVIGGTVWNVTDADDGGPLWVVVLVYTLVVGAMAAMNVLVVGDLRASVRARARSRGG